MRFSVEGRIFFVPILSKNLRIPDFCSTCAADIAQYGLMDVARDLPELAQYKEQMEDLGCQYIYIAIGKGLVPANYIEQMKSYWQGE